jgi:hypothetical protein
MLGLMAVWLAASGSSAARSATRLSEVSLRLPSLNDYLSTLPGKVTAMQDSGTQLTAAEIAAVDVAATIGRVFESIREFENGRSEFRLSKMKSVIAGVTPGSPAAQAGLMRGDELKSIWGKPSEFVWDLFVAVASNGGPRAEVDFSRGGTLYRASLALPSGAALDLTNMGMQFELPEGVRYLGPRDGPRLAEDFIRNYVEAIPPDWRKTYSASLDRVMRALLRRTDDQKARTVQDPAYLRSELILVWHHEAFIAELERFRADSLAASRQMALSVAGLGRAAAGLASFVFLSVLTFALHSRTRRQRRSHR